MKKRTVDWKHIDSLMDSTFFLGRKEVIEDEPLVKDIKSSHILHYNVIDS